MFFIYFPSSVSFDLFSARNTDRSKRSRFETFAILTPAPRLTSCALESPIVRLRDKLEWMCIGLPSADGHRLLFPDKTRKKTLKRLPISFQTSLSSGKASRKIVHLSKLFIDQSCCAEMFNSTAASDKLFAFLYGCVIVTTLVL